jgi:hypothetical protein
MQFRSSLLLMHIHSTVGMFDIVHVLERGPGDRVKLIRVMRSRPPSFAFSVPLVPTCLYQPQLNTHSCALRLDSCQKVWSHLNCLLFMLDDRYQIGP